jgi:hypothetical protein
MSNNFRKVFHIIGPHQVEYILLQAEKVGTVTVSVS